VVGNEFDTRVLAIGNTNWSYQIPSPPNGSYKIISHAVDKAGNIENSAVIFFKYQSENTNSDITPTPSEPEFTLNSNYTTNKITLAATNISSPFNYEIIYTGNGIEKGIYETATSNEIINSNFSKEFYLGTCSSGGVCTPENITVGSTITVNITGSQNLTKIFTY
jgi:hypothetical protein